MCPALGLLLGSLSSLLSPELFACVVLLPTLVLLLPSPSWLLFINLFLYFVNGPPWVLVPYQSQQVKGEIIEQSVTPIHMMPTPQAQELTDSNDIPCCPIQTFQ